VKILGIVGWSGSGKTTLLTALLPLLLARGLTVSTVKHTHHGFDMDRPGKDSFRHRAAGAHEVLVASSRRWALLHEVVGPEPPLPELLARLQPVDLVLVEGFKTHPFPKLEVHRPILGKPPIWQTEPDVVAVATDAPLPQVARPVLPQGGPPVLPQGGPSVLPQGGRQVLPLNDPPAVAAWLVDFLALERRAP
jgi:molybdopterin-guanine dinucleotide biosynthesis protein B